MLNTAKGSPLLDHCNCPVLITYSMYIHPLLHSISCLQPDDYKAWACQGHTVHCLPFDVEGGMYSRISLIRPSNLRAPPSTGHYLYIAIQINFLYQVSCWCWSWASDLCKLSIQHATAVFTQSVLSAFTPFWFL